jgi:hypothetical protein
MPTRLGPHPVLDDRGEAALEIDRDGNQRQHHQEGERDDFHQDDGDLNGEVGGTDWLLVESYWEEPPLETAGFLRQEM